MSGSAQGVGDSPRMTEGTKFIQLTADPITLAVYGIGVALLITGGVTFGLQVLPQVATLTMMGAGGAALLVMTVINLIRMKNALVVKDNSASPIPSTTPISDLSEEATIHKQIISCFIQSVSIRLAVHCYILNEIEAYSSNPNANFQPFAKDRATFNQLYSKLKGKLSLEQGKRLADHKLMELITEEGEFMGKMCALISVLQSKHYAFNEASCMAELASLHKELGIVNAEGLQAKMKSYGGVLGDQYNKEYNDAVERSQHSHLLELIPGYKEHYACVELQVKAQCLIFVQTRPYALSDHPMRLADYQTIDQHVSKLTTRWERTMTEAGTIYGKLKALAETKKIDLARVRRDANKKLMKDLKLERVSSAFFNFFDTEFIDLAFCPQSVKEAFEQASQEAYKQEMGSAKPS